MHHRSSFSNWAFGCRRAFLRTIGSQPLNGAVAPLGLKLYLSSRLARRTELLRMAAELEAIGHVVVSRWLRAPQRRQPTGRQAADVAMIDLDDIARADVLIAATDGPVAAVAGRGGRHVELGYALALRRRILLIGPPEHVFHHLPDVRRVATWGEARQVLAEWVGQGFGEAASA